MFHAPVALNRPVAGRVPGRPDLPDLPEEDHLSYVELRDGFDPRLGRPLSVGRSALGARLREPFDPYAGSPHDDDNPGPAEPRPTDPPADGGRAPRRGRSLFGPSAPGTEGARSET
jgi:hypothetical protein